MLTTLGVKLDEPTRDRLKSLSLIKQRSSHWLMREAITKYLDVEEAVETRNQQADAAWQAYKHTGKGASNETVTAWLDTWGTERESQCPKPKNLR